MFISFLKVKDKQLVHSSSAQTYLVFINYRSILDLERGPLSTKGTDDDHSHLLAWEKSQGVFKSQMAPDLLGWCLVQGGRVRRFGVLEGA